MSRYKDLYKSEIVDAMTKKFGYKNVMEVQKVVFFVINRNTGELRYLSKQAETSYADCESGEDFFESVIGKKLKPVIEEMDYGSNGEKTAEYYDDINDAWYTITVKEIEDGSNANDILLCVTDSQRRKKFSVRLRLSFYYSFLAGVQ